MFCTQCGSCIPNYCSCVHHTYNIIEVEAHSKKKKKQVAMTTVLNQLFLPFVSYLIAIIELLNDILYKIGGILFATVC